MRNRQPRRVENRNSGVTEARAHMRRAKWAAAVLSLRAVRHWQKRTCARRWLLGDVEGLAAARRPPGGGSLSGFSMLLDIQASLN